MRRTACRWWGPAAGRRCIGYAEPAARSSGSTRSTRCGTPILVNGKSGAGKTFLVQVLPAAGAGARCALRGDRPLGRSLRVPCALIDGARHVAVGGEDAHSVNPWDVEDPAAVGGAKVAFLVRLHARPIGDHHVDADAFGLAPLERNLLELAIRGVYCGRGADRPGAVRELPTRAARRTRQGTGAGAGGLGRRWRPPTARWPSGCTPSGSYGSTGRPRWTWGRRRWRCSTRVRSEEISPAVLFALFEFLTGHIERRREAHLRSAAAGGGRGRSRGASCSCSREAVEAHGAARHRGVAQRSRRGGRGTPGSLVCVTQQRSDLAGPWGKALLDNSTMQLLLRQSPDELAYLRDALKLADAEVEIVAHLRTDKRRAAQAYFMHARARRGLVRLGPRAYWIATSEPIEDAPARERALRDAATRGRRSICWPASTARPHREPARPGRAGARRAEAPAPRASRRWRHSGCWRSRRGGARRLRVGVRAPPPARPGEPGLGDPARLPAGLRGGRARLRRQPLAAGRDPPAGIGLLAPARPLSLVGDARCLRAGTAAGRPGRCRWASSGLPPMARTTCGG